MLPYRLTNELRTGLQIIRVKKKTIKIPWTEIRSNGDFRRTIDFIITDLQGSPVKKAGIIFQYITKKTNAIGVSETGEQTILNTSTKIAEYTDGNVKYMCDSYLEYFIVDKNGQTDGDQFGNGAIATYDGNDALLDPVDPVSKGTITQIGTSVFIPYGPFVKSILEGYPWDDTETLPANGLHYLPFNQELWERILDEKQSNELVQKVTISWGYGPESQGICIDCEPDFSGPPRPVSTNINVDSSNKVKLNANVKPSRYGKGGFRKTRKYRR